MMSSREQEWKEPSNRKEFQKIVTALFTACAKYPDAEFVIHKCNSIRRYLKKNDIKMNMYNYASAISAYGRAGAIYEAFNLVDEMIEGETVASAIRKRLLSRVGNHIVMLYLSVLFLIFIFVCLL